MGRALSADVHGQPAVEFQAIPSSPEEMHSEVAAELSTDQRLIYHYSLAVSAGTASAELARARVGPLNHG